MSTKQDLVGAPAPPITLPTASGDEYVLPLGQKPIALFFYPAANTKGCTIEACSFRDAQNSNPTFSRHKDLEIVGISRDKVADQKSFVDAHSLPYPVLCDVDGSAHKAYGLGKAFFGFAPERRTVFIGKDGIVKAQHTANVDMKSHVKFVEDQLRALDKQ